MTREEASKVIKDGLEDMTLDYIDNEQYEALNMAINALKQNESAEEWYKLFVEKLEQEPKGHWIAQDIHNCHTDFKCSECGYIHSFMHLYGEPTADYTYCPNCGAKMESEDKESHI